MQIDKLIKREIIMLLTFITILLAILVIFTYYNRNVFSINNNNNIIKIKNLELVFCTDKTCKNTYENKDLSIGMTKLNGSPSPNKLNSHKIVYDAIQENPYVISIKNTGKVSSTINIKLEENNKYYRSYINYIKLIVNDCINIPNEKLYINLNENKIIENEKIDSGEIKKYCLWIYLDDDFKSEEDIYFMPKLNIELE